MKIIVSSLILAGALVAGCGSADSVDTSAPAATAHVDTATKGVDSSTMSPEQKQAAAEYLKKGASNAQEMRKLAQSGGSGGAK